MKLFFEMVMMALSCFSVLVALFSFSGFVSGQSNSAGFISIDCGVSSGYSYIDKLTNITYVSDNQFVDAGVNYKIASNYINGISYQDQTLRSFPTGLRNCYTLNVTKGNKYFLRAVFMYGNYDGLQLGQLNNPILFDVYLGVNKWYTVKISDASREYKSEAVSVVELDTLSICLINIGQGIPFVSALEIRPVDNTLYPNSLTGTSISFLYRYNYGSTTDQIIRYPDDPMDRIWAPYPSSSDWSKLSVPSNSNFTKVLHDDYAAPRAVYQTAVSPIDSSTLTIASWNPESISVVYYATFYICDLLPPSSNNTARSFKIDFSGTILSFTFYAVYLKMSYIASFINTPSDNYVLSFVATSDSSHPPIVNALEIYWLFNHTVPETDEQDVKAITGIKLFYGIKRSWTGDPCSPNQYIWDGLNCGYPSNRQPTIISVNLSASRLSGVISDSFNQFKEIKNIDLSCNNLSGIIPDFLGNISTLQILNLRGNHFEGSIPDSLQKKNNAGLLNLITGPSCTGSAPTPEYSTNSSTISPNKNKKNTIVIVAVAIPLSLAVIVVLLLFFLKRLRRKDRQQVSLKTNSGGPIDESILNTEFRQFTYSQLKKVTRNFSKYIGGGGFGSVYHGFLENGEEVAVKLSSKATLRDITKQFLAEANNLMQVQHKNLVSLVGYCRESKHVALVYEFMPNQSLEDHLRGKAGISRNLRWTERVRIAIEAAQGLHYLHTGRSIVHRDVKSSNILLGQNMEAKVADFGLSKIFPENAIIQSTTLCGTPGYIDPESVVTRMTNEKSDVFSFGVVLLEIVTGGPPIVQERQNVHIIQHVNQALLGGNIHDVVDPTLHGEYDENSIWKVVDLAMQCTAQPSSIRPTMADVVKQLQDSLMSESKPSFNIFDIETIGVTSSGLIPR